MVGGYFSNRILILAVLIAWAGAVYHDVFLELSGVTHVHTAVTHDHGDVHVHGHDHTAGDEHHHTGDPGQESVPLPDIHCLHYAPSSPVYSLADIQESVSTDSPYEGMLWRTSIVSILSHDPLIPPIGPAFPEAGEADPYPLLSQFFSSVRPNAPPADRA